MKKQNILLHHESSVTVVYQTKEGPRERTIRTSVTIFNTEDLDVVDEIPKARASRPDAGRGLAVRPTATKRRPRDPETW